MLLYLWINKYKHITKTGFNLSSLYEFTFNIVEEKTKTLSGNLKCIKKKRANIFSENIEDIKAIIGENGAGKSTILEILIQNILTSPKKYFDGFLVTNNFIFNREGINFGNSISEIKYFDLKEVSNVDLVNFKRGELQRKLQPEEVKESYHGQIATSHLNNLSIIHYSPLLNIDRIENSEGIAGSSKKWETNFWHYYDYTTENCIVDDYNTLNDGETAYYISGESELLAHKSAESKRNLEFLSSEYFTSLPFKNQIGYVTIRLNDFYERFWDSIDSYFKKDSELEGRIQHVITAIKEKDYKQHDLKKEFESNLYVNFLHGAMKHEYRSLTSFGMHEKTNAIIRTIDKFLLVTKRTRIHKTALQQFLLKAQFANGHAKEIFNIIEKTVNFILKSKSFRIENEYSFKIPIKNHDTINEFLNLIYDSFTFGIGEHKRAILFHVFSIEYVGLSSGEKNLLSMFGRIYNAARNIPSSQTEIVFLLDEPEVTLHPQWQTSFISLLNENLPKLFPQKKLQMIITSHSPILVSDLPQSNILFLEKNEDGSCKVTDLKKMPHTFGANIHTLYADSFFLKERGGAMGEFAKGVIEQVINELNEEFPNDAKYLKSIIDLIGEPLIKNQLLELYYKKFPEQRINNIDERIAFLERELNLNKKLQQQSNNENN